VDALDVEVDDALANAFDPESRAWFGERDTDERFERFSLPEEVLEREETRREETNGGSGVKKKKTTSKNFVSCVAITARAPSFLYHQVRLMVATLVAVGAGDMTPADVQELLAKKDVSFAPPMAPACGLYLARVHYDGSRKWDARRGAASDG
jgi:tRNA pseudouridine(38-40) synthase